MKKETYVEIGARQTGKSRRLFKSAIEWSEHGDSVIFYPNWTIAIQYKNIFKPNSNLFHPNKLYTFGGPQFFIHNIKGIKFNNPRFFFDEFCFYDHSAMLELSQIINIFDGNYFALYLIPNFIELYIILCKFVKYFSFNK
jgi:thymidine kinase